MYMAHLIRKILRWSGRIYSSFLCSSSENATVKELLKLLHTIAKVIVKIKCALCTPLWTAVYK